MKIDNSLDWSVVKKWDDPNPDGKCLSAKNKHRLERYILMYYENPIDGRCKSKLAKELGITPQTMQQEATKWNWELRARLYDDAFKNQSKVDLVSLSVDALATFTRAMYSSIVDYVNKNDGKLADISDNAEIYKAVSLLDKLATNAGIYSEYGLGDNKTDDNDDGLSSEARVTFNNIANALMELGAAEEENNE